MRGGEGSVTVTVTVCVCMLASGVTADALKMLSKVAPTPIITRDLKLIMEQSKNARNAIMQINEEREVAEIQRADLK